MKMLSTKVDIPESYFGVEFKNVSLYFYEESNIGIIRLLVDGVKLGADFPISIDTLFPERDKRYNEENILFGVKSACPNFLTYK